MDTGETGEYYEDILENDFVQDRSCVATAAHKDIDKTWPRPPSTKWGAIYRN